jgi:membrane protein implicated in regulation of membrane protease activity
MGAVYAWGFRRRKAVYAADAEGTLAALWLGALSGLLAALAVGVVDHYFFNLAFQPAGTLFWMFVGLCLAATRLAVRNAEEKKRGSSLDLYIDLGIIAKH